MSNRDLAILAFVIMFYIATMALLASLGYWLVMALTTVIIVITANISKE
jgi:fatty acid desaturase